jgi:hypothetical protein
MSSWVIYTLSDPRDPAAIRYVGVTHRKPGARLACHLHCARTGNNNHRHNWIRKLLTAGVTPLLVVIDTGTGDGWGAVESWWIQWYRNRGFHLTNATDGGEGALGNRHTAETRAKMSESRMGLKLSVHTIARMAAGRVGVKQAPERVAKRSTSVKATWERKKAAGLPPPSAETRAKISAAGRGRVCSAATRAKRSASLKGRKYSPETLAKMSAAAKARWARQRSNATVGG